MSKSKASPSLYLALNPSIKLQHFNFVGHGLALIAALSNNLPWLVRIAIASVIATDFWQKRQRYKVETRIISYHDHLGWQLISKGNSETMEIMPMTVVTPVLIFLHIKGRPAQIIVHDALNEDDFRYLIVKLKLTINQQSKQDNFP